MSDENISPPEIDLSKVSDQRLDFVFPKTPIRVRIVDASDAPSKTKQTPMRTILFEIVSPESVEVNNKTWVISGFKINDNFVWTNNIAQQRLKTLHKVLKLVENDKPMPMRWKNAEDLASYEGKELEVYIGTEVKQAKSVADDDGNMVQPKDSDGNPVLFYQHSIKSFLS